MQLILHIGTEKTATTSTQNWLYRNRAHLKQQGVYYSTAFGQPYHAKVHLYALPPDAPDEGFARLGLDSAARIAAFRSEFPGEVSAEVQASRDAGCHTFLVSSELLQSRLRDASSVKRLHDLFAPHFDGMEVLCSLRPQVDMAVSLASTRIRNGLQVRGDYFRNVVPRNLYYDFDTLESRWASAFGKDRITFLAYRTVPELSSYLTARLKLDCNGFVPPDRRNEAIDVRVMAMVNRLLDTADRRTAGRGFLKRLGLVRLPFRDRLQPGLELAREIQDRFSAGNARLAERVTGLSLDDLTPDWSRYDAPPNLGLLDAPCVFEEQLLDFVMSLDEPVAGPRRSAAGSVQPA